jgi:nucleotide-binding universal stress UspA family protein
MKIISVLIDFTETSKVATAYALHLAHMQGSKINLVHITSTSNESSADTKEKILDFTGIQNSGIEYDVSLGDGDYMKQVPKLLQLSDSDFVVIGTHGQKGIFQTLFGANVIKLIQSLHVSALIVQNNSPAPEEGFSKILFPMGPHTNFHIKINKTAEWALLMKAQVEVFCLFKEDGTLPDNISKNLDLTKKTFTDKDVAHNLILRESKVYSIGYAREVLDEAKNRKANLISIMSRTSEENRYFGNVDKTNIVLNDMGIPVLCITE